MNIVYGVVSAKNSIVSKTMEDFGSYIKQRGYKAPKNVVKQENTAIAYTSSDELLMGVAAKGGIQLILNGFIYSPLPGWKNAKNPVEDTHIAAEYLLDRYLQDSKNFVSGVYGHFSVIIYDSGKDAVTLVRDPTGQNDLFYYEHDGSLVFSNKIKALAVGLGDRCGLDRSYEDFFLIYGFYPENRTMYKHVMAMHKKSSYTYKKGAGSMKSITYPDPPKASGLKDEQSIIDGLYGALVDGMKDMLPSKKTKCAVLLGGFDSALVASLLVKLGMEVETFSFYYEDEKYNQLHTDTVAKFLGIKHNWVKVDEKTIQHGLENFANLFNQPTNWPSYVIQTAHLCEEIRKQGFKYCYTGDGCDALFYGYPLTFKRAQVLSKIGALPNPLLNALVKVAERPLLERVIGRPYQVGMGALRSATRDESVRTLLTFRVFDELSLKQLRKYPRPKQSEPTEHIVSRLAEHHRGKSAVNLGYEGKKMVSPNKNKMNGSADSSGLTIASPYMHYVVSAFAATIPDELLRPKNSNKIITGKYILSKMADDKGLLPHDVIYQPKIGAADSPIEDWYRGPLRETLDRQLRGLPFQYSKRYVKSLVKETFMERQYAKLISKDTSSLVTMSHCISLLATYSSFTKIDK